MGWALGAIMTYKTDDLTISRLTFCIVQVLDQRQLPGRVLDFQISIKVLRVLHGSAAAPNSFMTVPVQIGIGSSLLRMPVSKGDTALIVLEMREAGSDMAHAAVEMMPECSPLCRITGDNDKTVLSLQRLFELYAIRDRTQKLSVLIHALGGHDMVVVTYAFNELSKLSEDPALKDRIYDEFLKIRDNEKLPVVQRLKADETIYGISPAEYSWSVQRQRFLEELSKRSDIGEDVKREIKSRLDYAKVLKRALQRPN
jgi:hypothetical protein